VYEAPRRGPPRHKIDAGIQHDRVEATTPLPGSDRGATDLRLCHHGLDLLWTSGNRGREPETPHSAAVRALSLGGSHMEVPDGPIRWFGCFAEADVDPCG
jgi:hypothetical protein